PIPTSSAFHDASGSVAWVLSPDVSIGLPSAASAFAQASGKPSRVDAERDTTSTFQPPPRNMAMIPTPMVPPPTTRVWRSLCDIIDPPNSTGTSTGAPAAGQYRRSSLARGGNV